MSTLRSWHAEGRSAFFMRLAAIGAVGGVAAWVVVFVAHLLWEITAPTPVAFPLALLRGAIFGLILGLILDVVWRRGRKTSE